MLESPIDHQFASPLAQRREGKKQNKTSKKKTKMACEEEAGWQQKERKEAPLSSPSLGCRNPPPQLQNPPAAPALHATCTERESVANHRDRLA
jgi:hypothetical protein